MGIRGGIFVFLRPPYHGGKDRTGRPGSRVKEIGFERERERERYYADSEMDFRVFAASLLWGFGGGFRVFQASLLWVNTAVAVITVGGWAKVIIRGGSIAEME